MADKTILERVAALRTDLQALIAESQNVDINDDFVGSLKDADANLADAEAYGTNTNSDTSEDEE